MLKVEHIGIAVKSLAESVPFVWETLNNQFIQPELVESDYSKVSQNNGTDSQDFLQQSQYVLL